MVGGEKDGEEASLKVRARCRESMLSKAFYLLVDRWKPEERKQIALNCQLLRIVSESYFKDLERKKTFHGIRYADEHKRAGYMVKWIMRFRPIQLTGENCCTKALLINEHFALTVGLKFLRLSPDLIPPGFYYNLVYSLRYRAIDANAWALSCYLMQQAFDKSSPPSEEHGPP